MFRVSVKTQLVAGQLHYHLRCARVSDNRVCAVAELHQSEWLAFLQFAEHDHRFEIEVEHERVPTAPATSTASQ